MWEARWGKEALKGKGSVQKPPKYPELALGILQGPLC